MLSAEALQLLEESDIALVLIARRGGGRGVPAFIEIVQFLARRHPEIRMRRELMVKPGGAGFLRTDAKKIGTRAGNKRIGLWLCRFGREPNSKLRKPVHLGLIFLFDRDLLVAMTVFDNEIDPLQEIDVTQHVAFHRDDVGELPFADRAVILVHFHHDRGPVGRSANRRH